MSLSIFFSETSGYLVKMPADLLKTLIPKRGQIKAILTRFQSYLDSLEGQENISTVNLEERLNRIRVLLEKFEDISFEIVSYKESEADDANEVSADFEKCCFDTITRAREMISKNCAESRVKPSFSRCFHHKPFVFFSKYFVNKC